MTMKDLLVDFTTAFGKQDISFDEARTVIGLAFAGTDTVPPEPVSQFMMEPVGLTEQQSTQHFKTFVMSYPIMESLKMHKAVLVGERQNENDRGNLMSCMVIREYDNKHKIRFLSFKKSWYFLRCTIYLLMTRHGIPEVFTNRKLKEKETQFQAIADQFDALSPKWHKEHGPPDKHWYVQFLGVNPSHQGKGCGSRLMRCLNEAADKKGIAIYLECSGDKNKSFYEKHGYIQTAQTILTDPHDPTRSLVNHCMTRQPNK